MSHSRFKQSYINTPELSGSPVTMHFAHDIFPSSAEASVVKSFKKKLADPQIPTKSGRLVFLLRPVDFGRFGKPWIYICVHFISNIGEIGNAHVGSVSFFIKTRRQFPFVSFYCTRTSSSLSCRFSRLYSLAVEPLTICAMDIPPPGHTAATPWS